VAAVVWATVAGEGATVAPARGIGAPTTVGAGRVRGRARGALGVPLTTTGAEGETGAGGVGAASGSDPAAGAVTGACGRALGCVESP